MMMRGTYELCHGDESLRAHCTAKQSHVGSGGKVARFIVTIVHQKVVVLCEQYKGKINRGMF